MKNDESYAGTISENVIENNTITNRILLICFCFINISALIYEVAWSRIFSYVFGTSMFAISAVLSSFMGGLAFGSFIGGRLSNRLFNTKKLFAYFQILIGIYGISTIIVFRYLSDVYLFIYNNVNNFNMLNIILFVFCFIVLIIPTSLIGASFPLFSNIYIRENKTIGKGMGKVYSADTAGSAIGAITSGFLLIPLFGLSKTILLAAMINMIIGVLILRGSNK